MPCLADLLTAASLEVHGQCVLTGDYQPGFKAELHLKDLHIMDREAQGTGLTLDALHLMKQLIKQGNSGSDSAALAEMVRQRSLKKG